MIDRDLFASSVANRYVIERELGSGGMATVFLAEDLKHRRRVAVKVVNPELAAVLGPQRFLREIEVTASLDHPHILPLFDSGEAAGFLYYVMPYVEGQSLRDRLAGQKQLAVGEAVEITRQIALALRHAHQHGLVHRDIKPENILLSAGLVRVADFGIAKAVHAAGGEPLTQTGIAIGTASYMSPEQAAGGKDLDGRSDLYALGCVLYEMLAGEPPFTGPTVESIVHQHLAVEPRPVTALRPRVPGALTAVISGLLAKSPADRIGSADALIEALSRSAADTPSPPVPTRPHTPALIAAAGVLLMLAGWWAVRSLRAPSSGSGSDRVTVAVLAPESISDDPQGQTFADGVHEELLNALAGISGLGVTGRASALYYRNHPKPVRDIARELGVQGVVELSVRRAGDNVRITVQLIDGETQQHRWSQTYDRRYSPVEIFAIQADVARQIAGELRVQLTGEELTRLADVSTESTEAYEAYLQATAFARRTGQQARQREADHLRRAVRHDPGFAAAWGRLSQVLLFLVVDWNQYELADQALAARTRAEELAPNGFQTLMSRGAWLYRSTYDLDGARAVFRAAHRLHSSDTDVLVYLAQVERRAGNWDAALAAHQMSLERDPLSSFVANVAALTHGMIRDYDAAIQLQQRAMQLEGSAYDLALAFRIRRAGDVEAARRWADSVSPDAGPEQARLMRLNLAYYDRELTAVFEEVRRFHAMDFERLAKLCHLLRDIACRAGYGDSLLARHRAGLAALDRSPIPVWPRARAFEQGLLAIAHAARGARDSAIAWGNRAIATGPPSVDAYTGAVPFRNMADAFILLGEHDAAVEMLERVLSVPAFTSAHELKVDPWYDALRGNPRFQALLAKYAQ